MLVRAISAKILTHNFLFETYTLLLRWIENYYLKIPEKFSAYNDEFFGFDKIEY